MHKAGWLLRKGRSGQWKRSYVVLANQFLSYSDTQSETNTRGKISLAGATVALITEQNSQKHIFTVTPIQGRIYQLQTEGSLDESEWVEALKKAAKTNPRRGVTDWNSISLTRPASLSWTGNSLSQWRQPLVLIGITGIQPQNDDRKQQPLSTVISHQTKIDAAFCAVSTMHNKHEMFCLASNGSDSSLLATIAGSDARSIARLQGLGGHWEQSSLGPSHISWIDSTMLLGTRNGKIAHYALAENEAGMRKDYAPTSTFALADTVPVRKILLNPRQLNQFCTLAGRAINVWDLATSSPVASELGSTSELSAGAWNMHTPNEFVIGTANGTLKLIDARVMVNSPDSNCALWRVSKAHTHVIRDVKWSPFVSHWLASAGDDGIVKVWDLRFGGRPVRQLTSHLNSVSGVAWSKAHSELLTSIGADACLKLWNINLQPHFIAHTEKTEKVRWREGGLVGVDFANDKPCTCFTVSGVGQISTVDFQQIISLQTPTQEANSEKSVHNRQAEAVIRTKLYLRDESAAMEAISTLAEKYARSNHWDWAASLLDLAQPSFAQAANEVPNSMADFDRLSNTLARLIPPGAPKQTVVDQRTTNKIQFLHLRVALITYLNSGQWEKLLELEHTICNQLQTKLTDHDKKEEIGDSSVIRRIVIAIAERDPARGLNFALSLAKQLKQASWPLFLTTCQWLLSPSIYGKLDLYEEQGTRVDDSSDEEDAKSPTSPEQNGKEVIMKDGKAATQVEKDVRAMLDKHLRNAAFVTPQLTLFAKLCGVVPTFLPFAGSRDAWFVTKKQDSTPQEAHEFIVEMTNEQAQAIMELCEKQGIQEQKAIQDHKAILPANVYRVYYSALLQLKNYDKLFILVTQLIHGLRASDSPFCTVLGHFIDLVFDRFKLFLDKAFKSDAKSPWRTGTKTAACLTIVNIMYNCPFLPLCLQKCLPESLWTLTQQLSAALQETRTNPGFKASAKGAAVDCAEIATGILQQLRRIQELKPLDQKDTPRGVNDLIKMLTSYTQTQ